MRVELRCDDSLYIYPMYLLGHLGHNVPTANEVCEGYVDLQVSVILSTGGGMCGCSGGACVVAHGGACVVTNGGRAWLLRGACMVAPGGHVWLLMGGDAWLLGGACMVAPGGVHGCSWGGMCGCSGGRVWLHGGACVVFLMRNGTMSGRYSS